MWVQHPRRTRFTCPQCERELPIYDHADEREWRHLDSCQFLTYLHAKPPRVNCPEHGVVQVQLPWAEPMSRFTILFERLAVDVLKVCRRHRCRPLVAHQLGRDLAFDERAVAR